MADYNFVGISTFYRYYLQQNTQLKWEDTNVGHNTIIPLPVIDDSEYSSQSLEILDVFYQNLLSLGSKKLTLNTITYLAQHYGLPTNLIDFSADPKVALYFACQEFPEQDCIVYEYDIYKFVKNMYSFFKSGGHRSFVFKPDGSVMTNEEVAILMRDKMTVIDREVAISTPILKLDEIVFSQRILNQKGTFVYINEPTLLDRIMYTSSSDTYEYGRKLYKIPAKFKAEILSYLKIQGIDFDFLYPKADGDSNLSTIKAAVDKTKKMLSIP